MKPYVVGDSLPFVVPMALHHAPSDAALSGSASEVRPIQGTPYTSQGACISLQVLMELKGRIVPLPPCLSEDCMCHGVFYKEVCTTSSRLVAIAQLHWDDGCLPSEQALAKFKAAPPAVTVKHTAPDGSVSIIRGGADFDVSATFAPATATSPDQWVLFFRPKLTTNRHCALCTLRVGDALNYVDLPMEIRSKPSAWLVVENIPTSWDMAGLEAFLREFCAPVQIRCTVSAPHTAFVKLATRPLATSVMDKWSSKAPALLAKLQAPDLVVSWALNLNKPCSSDQPFETGSGWKAPSYCRIGRVFQEGAEAGHVVDEPMVDEPACVAEPQPALEVRPRPAKRLDGRADLEDFVDVMPVRKRQRVSGTFSDAPVDDWLLDLDGLLDCEDMFDFDHDLPMQVGAGAGDGTGDVLAKESQQFEEYDDDESDSDFEFVLPVAAPVAALRRDDGYSLPSLHHIALPVSPTC